MWLKVTYNLHLNHKRIQRLMNQLGIKAVISIKRGICDFR
ncbi:TPA: transposase [Bacillus toyonensis]|nr:transposase [Bacillus toyonensis]